jgi:hypothetical protein
LSPTTLYSQHLTSLANMSAETDPLLALDVSTDDYAITAAHDQKAGTDATLAAVEAEDVDSDTEREKAGAARAARTRYTEEDFLAQKASYTARIDEGSVSGFCPQGCWTVLMMWARFGNNCFVLSRLFARLRIFWLL